MPAPTREFFADSKVFDFLLEGLRLAGWQS